MAEAVVSLALETLTSMLLEEGRFLAGIAGEVRALQAQLREIKCLLRDADRKQHESESVRNWIAEIRDLAYRSEDATASYAAQISRRRLLPTFSNLHHLGGEISEIKSELARVTACLQSYGISRVIDGDRSSENDGRDWERRSFPNFEIGDCLVGMEEELDRLASLLVNAGQNQNQNRVVSIWGMGGIGKTTLAKQAYNQMNRNAKFDASAWICVTQQCRIRSILESILQQLVGGGGGDSSNLSEERLIEQLCEVQRDKRCLIVLDDLWEISHWNGLKHAFLVEDLKSKILITTRKHKVAEIGISIKLGLLSLDHAWELLKKKAFPQANNPEFASDEKLHKIGEKMVRKCGYLPLAISLLGGVLSKKSCIREWELVNEDINASIYGAGQGYDDEDDNQNQIDRVLNLSYHDLPFYLKSCFLYLGRLREDESIYVVDLYRMWTAQGMIDPDQNFRGNDKTLTDIAELYLGELASRSLVQVEVEDAIPSQKYRSCKLHDVVRELCLKMGDKEDFGVQVLEYQGGNFTTLLDKALSRIKTRHLAVHFNREVQLEHDDHELTITSGEDIRKHLRSLHMFHDIDRKTIEFPPQSVVDFQKFKMLKGLLIVRFKFPRRKLPRGITRLVHLKYLRLQECELDKLPSSISNLVGLETLDLHHSWNVRVPNVLKKMVRLKHLLLPCYAKKTVGNYRLTLDVGDELESLIDFDSSVHELKSIIGMKNLRRFSATIHNNGSLSMIINAIATEWTKLLYCAVSIKQGCELTTSEQGLVNLKQALTCPKLYYLGVYVGLGKLLRECRNEITSSKLVSLSLIECRIEDDPMELLGGLPCLRILYLYSGSFVGEEMTCPSSSFPCMRTLVLHCLPNLRVWTVEEGAMPQLSAIHISMCRRLEKAPNGFSYLSTLEKQTISGMPGLGMRVMASGDDFHKVHHVPSIVIDY